MVRDSESKRPDGQMSQIEGRIIMFSTGYIKVKATKHRTSSQKTHEDTLHLVEFCKNTLEMKNMKAAFAVQHMYGIMTHYPYVECSIGRTLCIIYQAFSKKNKCHFYYYYSTKILYNRRRKSNKDAMLSRSRNEIKSS